ncbi:MAG TPA: DegT/DnrJ/EryC1/StrS family aminotransferase [Acidobacteriaceae bacterium]|nr:DegT/DnrJ/EryC1/StrS family aminotransferase [Acidobacteriaceae bacterium]
MPETATRGSRQTVQMLDFRREFSAIRSEILDAIAEVCDSQRFILGPQVERFERAAAAACGVPYAGGCASGTDALWLALAALKIGPGDAVVTTPFSFFATVSSILRAGAVPVLADIDPATFNLSAAAVEERLEQSPVGASRIAGVMPVHLYGQCAQMDAFAALAKQYEVRIVEDAAQAFGASWKGVRAGGLGDAAAFSFYPTKNLAAMGDAGMVTTRSAEVDERVRMLRTHGMRRRYFHDEIGWNARMDTIQAAVLEVKLRRVEAGNARRREIAALYDKAFRDAGLAAKRVADGIVLPWTDPRAEHVFHQYCIRAPRRDALRAFLAEEGVGSEIYYPLPLHLQESLAFLGYKRGDFPESERAADEVLALPIYPELREDEVETVVDGIRRFYT